ncbi:type II toxin-antitoxin system PemK/MazF family toxin [Desulfofundulus sp. TPOSR]|uniref:type II toxin-antitoxin system PemK/MazF family toxin n=1 Tax=Desulfofundulus sp. TPOSR TaxID=2714340 RepID=UPI0014072B92|nr:type II toxin-antitoxin system PemK/MazF family toxin [Desulfofundulus sp. TPOSR]NHM28251.1 type II toxin-antitoxin system PemK/MazF family toxin [Desulfofundulus sp. TPOSR]
MVTYRWRIFWVSLDPVAGSEQGGKRPALVVSAEEVNQSLPVVTILPITSFKPGRKVYATEVFLSKEISGLPKDFSPV